MIDRLRKQLVALRAAAPDRGASSARSQRSPRASRACSAHRAATIRAAHFATVKLHMATPPAGRAEEEDDGPLHGLGVAFRWIGIGAIYAVALGMPCSPLVRARLVPRPRPRAAAARKRCSAGLELGRLALGEDAERRLATGSSPNSGFTQPVVSARDS